MEHHSSVLASAQDRFLASTLSFALETQWLTSDDLLSLFPPNQIMEVLEAAPALRNRILVEIVGVHEKIAPKKSCAAATEDLTIALAEGVASSAQLFSVLTPDECVRHLPREGVWQALLSSNFWRKKGPDAEKRVELMLALAEREGLVSQSQILEQVGLLKFAEELPKSQLEAALVKAVEFGMSGRPFTPQDLEAAVPRTVWLAHVPLTHVYERVISGTIAPALGLGSSDTPLEAPSRDAGSPRPDAKPSEPQPVEVANESPLALPAVSETRPVEAATGSAPEAEPGRQRAIENLRLMGRLPNHFGDCSTPLLLGLDAMCSEMRTLGDEDEREACIRDAFPNEGMLKDALLHLAEVLDPRLDRAKLIAQGADLESLVQIVLFEEQRVARRSSNPDGPLLEAETAPAPDVRVLLAPPAPPPPAPSSRSMPAPPPLPLPALGRSKGPGRTK